MSGTKHFLIRGLWFTILLFLITYAADYAISHSINKGFRHETWKYIYSGKGDCDLAIFGSSRAIFHFNPQIIEDSLRIKVWNFGFDGACIDLVYLRMSEYIRNCKRVPKYMTLVLDWQSFPFANKLAKHYQLFPYLLLKYDFFSILRTYEGFEDYYFFVPIIRYSNYYKDFFKEEDAEYIYNGFCSKDRHFDWANYLNEKDKSIGFKINIKKEHYFSDILKLCRENGILLNIVIAPEYKGGQDIVTYREAILNAYKKWADDSSLVYEDFSDTTRYKINSDTAYFYNCMHLNAKGADKFTSEMYVPFMKRIISEN